LGAEDAAEMMRGFAFHGCGVGCELVDEEAAAHAGDSNPSSNQQEKSCSATRTGRQVHQDASEKPQGSEDSALRYRY